MELTSPSVIKYLLKKYGLWAKKSFGQHFLIDKNILGKTLAAAGLSKRDVILEIGPGIGTLTRALCQQAKRVITVEIDKGMVKVLKEILKDAGNAKIVEGDILKLSLDSLSEIDSHSYKIVANIPYQITSSVLEKFLTSGNQPKEMVLMVQKEVAEKICARPSKMNRLGVFVQFFAKPRLIAKVSKNSFWPKPEVDSAILRIENIGFMNKRLGINEQKELFEMVKRGFSQKRKQLKNIFKEAALKKAGIMPTMRAENLSIDDWLNLYHAFKKDGKNNLSDT